MAYNVRKFRVAVACLATYTSIIDVPSEMSVEEAVAYAKEHIAEIPVGELSYISDSDEIDEENCGFADEEELP